MIRRPAGRWTLRICVAAAGMLSSAPLAAQYVQTNLVSDIPGLARTTDPALKNPWGISFSGTSPFWVSDAGSGVSTLYSAAGVKQGLTVSIPGPGGAGTGVPTGQVFNSAGAGTFTLSNNTSATFMFASVTGSISGWNPTAGTNALVTGAAGTSFTGLTLAGTGTNARLYAADFGAGRVAVFDGAFGAITNAGFVDPNLPVGYSPFNVQNVGGNIVVTYAIVDPVTHRALEAPGTGIVDLYDPNGVLLRRVVGDGVLNAPWGVALAPSGFGPFGGSLLVGNFGDGTINAYDFFTGALRGTLTDVNGVPIMNDHLWAITFGNNGAGASPNTLYLAAGIENEQHGLFASIVATPEPGSLVLLATGMGLLLAGAGGMKGRRKTT